MSREIIFRGKSEVTNEWVYGSLVKVGNESHIVGFDEVDLDGHHLSYCSDRPIFTKQGTIGQFTGLTDKKGREIYEGDVLRINNGAVICLLVVTWNAEVGSWCLRFKEELKEGTRPLGRWLCDRDYDIELTGNIYDNKELLEE